MVSWADPHFHVESLVIINIVVLSVHSPEGRKEQGTPPSNNDHFFGCVLSAAPRFPADFCSDGRSARLRALNVMGAVRRRRDSRGRSERAVSMRFTESVSLRVDSLYTQFGAHLDPDRRRRK